MGRKAYDHESIFKSYEELKDGRTLAQIANLLEISTATLNKILKDKGIHHPKYGKASKAISMEFHNKRVLACDVEIPKEIKTCTLKHSPSLLEKMAQEERLAADAIKQKFNKEK